MPPGDSVSSPGGHTLFFRAVLPAITLVRWVNENAFVPETQTRPCPPLADRFILGIVPIDCSSALLLMPFGFHLAMDTLPSEVQQAVASGRSWLSSFRFRARLDVSIPSAFSGQRGYYPPLLDMAPLI